MTRYAVALCLLVMAWHDLCCAQQGELEANVQKSASQKQVDQPQQPGQLPAPTPQPSKQPPGRPTSTPGIRNPDPLFDFPLATPVAAVQGNVPPLTFKGKTRYWVRATFSPQVFGRTALTAGIAHWRGNPDEWGTDAEGYGQRFGIRYASTFTRRTVQYLVGAALREDPRYFRSELTGFWPRTKYVLRYTVMVRRDDGSDSVYYGRLAGAFAAGAVTSVWHPEQQHFVARGVQRGVMNLGFDAGTRFFQEFWPDIRRSVLKRKR